MKKLNKKRIDAINLRLWSLIVRTRFDNVCLKCYTDLIEKGYSEEEAKRKATKSTDAHHVFPKSNHAVRFDPENGVSLCYYHHRFWIHSSKSEQTRIAFLRKFVDYDELEKRSRRVVKNDLSFQIASFVKLCSIGQIMGIDMSFIPKYLKDL